MQAFLDVMNRKMMEKFNIPMPPPPCALPPFTDKLPMDAKQEVEAIWSQYEEGSDCSKQHELTKAVIDALPQEVKESILPPGPPPMPPTTNPNEPAPVGPPPPRVLPKPDTSAPNVPPPLPLKQY
uniref:Uncharacterized protein n=1 Tax=Plectus sambesii TaxID=2011161 RepID=A0A914UNU6_9BILA